MTNFDSSSRGERRSTASVDIKNIVSGLRAGGELAAEARRLIVGLGNIALADLIEQSVIDTKTGLWQQKNLEDTIDELLACEKTHGIFMATDIINFGLINNKLGQQHGDEILAYSAAALRHSVRTTQLPFGDKFFQIANTHYSSDEYRIGGDEFAVLLRSDMSFSNAEPQAILRDKLRSVVSDPELQALIRRLGLNQFGIRGSVVKIDKNIHHGYKDIITAADPKLKTRSIVILECSEKGKFTIIEPPVDK